MNEFLTSLKVDLLSKRMLPIVVLVGVLLCAAIAYAVHGGGGSGQTKVAALAPSTPAAAAPSASAAPDNPKEAISETTNGASYQRAGGAHDPFLTLPTPHVATAKRKSAASTTTPAATTPSTTGSGGTTPSAPKPTAPKAKPKQAVYHVAALFGLAPTTPGQSSQLTPYEDLTRLQPLPTKSNALLVFNGVNASGKSAIFTQLQEGIPHGPGECLPSAIQCDAIALKPGEVEGFEYISASGQSVTYQLQVVSIAKSQASIASAQRFYQRESRVGRKLLFAAAPPVLANLRYSWRRGVLRFVAHPHRKHR